jgi:hypothetical protein
MARKRAIVSMLHVNRTNKVRVRMTCGHVQVFDTTVTPFNDLKQAMNTALTITCPGCEAKAGRSPQR